MTERRPESEEAAKARRMRSIVIAVTLAAFVVLVFIVTLTRVGSHVADAPY